ncbi:hypothetical protein [Kaarinaea lacus]
MFYTYLLSLQSKRWLRLIALALLAVFHSAVLASDVQERRVQISLPVFARVIAVDNGFRDKLSDNNIVILAFVYNDNRSQAEQMTASLQSKIKNIARMKYQTKIVTVSDLVNGKGQAPTAIFLAQNLPAEKFDSVIVYAKAKQRIVFSPFVGDVERGASAGIAITSRVNPYFNLTTLRDSKVEIHALLMQMSKTYE